MACAYPGLIRRSCRAAVKSRTGTLLFSTLFRDLTTISYPFNRGLLYLNRGPTAPKSPSAIWIQQSGDRSVPRNETGLVPRPMNKGAWKHGRLTKDRFQGALISSAV